MHKGTFYQFKKNNNNKWRKTHQIQLVQAEKENEVKKRTTKPCVKQGERSEAEMISRGKRQNSLIQDH